MNGSTLPRWIWIKGTILSYSLALGAFSPGVWSSDARGLCANLNTFAPVSEPV